MRSTRSGRARAGFSRALPGRVTIGAAATAAVALALAGTSLAQAATPAPSPVPQGVVGSALPGAKPFENTPGSTPEAVTFVLKERNAAQLEALVEGGTKRFVSVGQFKAEYGQSDATVKALTNYLKSYGISTTVYANNIDVSATGTADEFNRALSVTQKQYHVPAVKGSAGRPGHPAQTIHAPAAAPKLPGSVAASVAVVLGLSNYAPYESNSQNSSAIEGKTAPADTATYSGDCTALTGLSSACNTPLDFASRYGLSPLEKKSDGAGQTIGIVTLAALDPGAPQYYWSNIVGLPNTNRSVTVKNIDGGPGAPSDADGTGETDIDVEQSGGVAPGANIDVYQAPNTDAGFADAFFQAASDDTAGSVSTSWGESETIIAAAAAAGQEPSNYEAAFDEAFLELAIQGQSTFDASADEGAYTAIADAGTTNPSVDVSAASPYVTAAGGTTLPFSHTFGASLGLSLPVTVSAERAWGWDYLFGVTAAEHNIPLAEAAESDVSGDGGGFSVDQATPSYQKGVSGTQSYSAVQYFTPTDYQEIAPGFTAPTDWSFNPTPKVTHGTATGRAIPDLSTDADPETGYLLYEPSATQANKAPLQGGWGGTSFVAPQLAGASAVIDSVNGGRAGLWNAAMYKSASSRSSAFTPLNTPGTSNDNLLYTGTPGTVFNPATGLGTPNLTKLAAALR
ncbi:protease pro-enzyme activation domain-containing protein [Gryllotalpicola reticulitermitis]|uniref:Protease pro-enzyme activation domain-containing protein n=1 Tax=Gryllotalpicola reticulitermitis TaxID=1184153 RepID=A0ABV8Q6X5_9MICO